jgi:hypothetical protein
MAIEEQQGAITMGVRPGTKPPSIVIPKDSSLRHAQSQSVESNGLFALAEVASAVAEKTLESLQPVASAGSTVLTWKDKGSVDEKPVATHQKQASVNRPKAQVPKRDRKKRNAATHEEPADPNEPTYCYCDRVSFGDVSSAPSLHCRVTLLIASR